MWDLIKSLWDGKEFFFFTALLWGFSFFLSGEYIDFLQATFPNHTEPSWTVLPLIIGVLLTGITTIYLDDKFY